LIDLVLLAAHAKVSRAGSGSKLEGRFQGHGNFYGS
jgi:hypothetical protein